MESLAPKKSACQKSDSETEISPIPPRFPSCRGATFRGHAQSRRGYPHAMAVSTAPAGEKRRSTPGNARKRKSKKKPGWFALSWPLLLGIAVTPLAIHAASIMALAGPGALTALYPWILLLKNPALGPGGGLGDNLSQLLMY